MIVFATSSHLPSRLSGMELIASRTTVRDTFFTIPDSIMPGATALTRTPRGASSAASVRVKLKMAPFEAL